MKLIKLALILSFLTVSLNSGDALASKWKPQQKAPNNKYASLVVDADSGTIVHQENADAQRYPASLTKLMTLYLTFEALKYNKIKLTDYTTASRHAASQPRTNIALKPGEHVSIKTLVESLVVVSANDSAVVLAEKLGGTERNFAALMTKRAHQLGMSKTNFVNASGLHSPRQYSTAKDMAKLMMALKRDFPSYYPMLSQKHFSYKGVQYGAHSSVMTDYKYCKAGKTGYVRASGFNLVVGAEKGQKDVVAVVMGGRTARTRDNFMVNLLERSFSKMPGKSYASAVSKY